MKRTYSIFDKRTGRFTGRIVGVPASKSPNRLPPHLGAIEGQHDRDTRKVVAREDIDGETGRAVQVLEVVEAAPDPAIVAARTELKHDSAARQELIEIDAKLIRYIDAKDEGTIDAEGLDRLAALRDRKRELRTKLKR